MSPIDQKPRPGDSFKASVAGKTITLTLSRRRAIRAPYSSVAIRVLSRSHGVFKCECKIERKGKPPISKTGTLEEIYQTLLPAIGYKLPRVVHRKFRRRRRRVVSVSR